MQNSNRSQAEQRDKIEWDTAQPLCSQPRSPRVAKDSYSNIGEGNERAQGHVHVWGGGKPLWNLSDGHQNGVCTHRRTGKRNLKVSARVRSKDWGVETLGAHQGQEVEQRVKGSQGRELEFCFLINKNYSNKSPRFWVWAWIMKSDTFTGLSKYGYILPHLRQRYNRSVEHLPKMQKALDLTLNTTKQKKGKRLLHH